MEKTLLQQVAEIYPLKVRPYEQYIDDTDNTSSIEKINAMIKNLHHMGRITNDVVLQWNNVMKWVVDEGIENITTEVLREKLDIALNSDLKDLTLTVADEQINKLMASGQFEVIVESAINSMHENIQGSLNGFSAQLDDNTKRIKNTQVDLVVDFDASPNKADNHDNIMSALNYLNDNGGGTLLVPIGVFKTSALVLTNLRNIIIKGVSPSLPWKTTSCFKFIGGGEVGIQLSEIAGLGYENEVPTWSSTEIVIENIRVDCDKKINTGINANYGITLKNVSVDYALKDGIVFEPQTYPILMNRVFVRYSGRHGLYVKAPFTTVYNLYDCEFQRNDGYGMYIEDGSTCLFVNVLLQQNKQGGMKIEKKNPSLYTKETFLSNFLFINLYTEDSGTLLNSDPNFEGNCAVKTVSYDKLSGSNIGKISGLTFINSTVNASRPLGFTSKAWDLSGIDNVTTTNTIIPENNINFNENGTMGMRTNISTVLADIDSSSPLVRNIPYYDKVKNIKTMIGNGYVGKRGRMRELHFILPSESIAAGQTILMNSVYSDEMKFYPILQAGSLFGINVLKSVKPTEGTLTFKIKTNFKSLASGGLTTYLNTNEVIQLDNTKNNVSINFPLLNYTVDASHIIGIEVTASSDYVAGHASYSDFLCELFIES